MARMMTLQTSFTSGVLNPSLSARTDITHYFEGMRTGVNVISKKEGGALGRWGRRYRGDGAGNGRLVEFSFNTEQNYLFLFSDLKLEVWKVTTAGALERVTNINASGDDFLVTPWTEAQALEFDYTQSADTMIITHCDVQPRTLVRGADDATWTLATLATTNLPQFDFNDADSPTPTSHVVSLTFNSFADGDRYRLELEGFETPDIVYSATDTDANERRIRDELLLLPPTGFAESSITVAYLSGTNYTITYSGESADDYEDMTGRNTDNTGASITLSTTTTGAPRREDPISATRGWPRSVTFYENRLWFGAPKSLPQSLLGTQIGAFFPFNFDLGTGLDDQGVFATLLTDSVNEIRALYPGRHLQLFTSGGEFYSPSRPITPAPALPRQSRYGTALGLRPVEVDGATIYVTRTRKTVREYLYNWGEDAYRARSLSVLSSHLLSDIRSIAALTSTGDDEESYVICVNGDGSAATLNTLRDQDVAAWTADQDRAGDKIKQVAVIGEQIAYLMERQRNGATVYTIEQADFSTRLDSAATVTSGLGLNVSGFAHLAGETVKVLVDGAPVDDQTVNGSGELTFAVAPTASVEAGYFTPPIVETMPLNVNLGAGPMLGEVKRLSEIRVHVKDTLGIVANGWTIPDQVAGQVQFDTPTTPVSGITRTRDLGWDDGEQTITLTQEQPLPFHVLALSAELQVGRT
jgi:hypothetical protein